MPAGVPSAAEGAEAEGAGAADAVGGVVGIAALLTEAEATGASGVFAGVPPQANANPSAVAPRHAKRAEAANETERW